MKAAFILEHCDNPVLIWPQLQINMHKLGPVRDPMDHLLLQLCHQGEEGVHPVIDYIWSFMAIHIDTFFQRCAPPSQLDEPSPSCLFRQVFRGWIPKCQKDSGVKGMLEPLGGDLTHGQAR